MLLFPSLMFSSYIVFLFFFCCCYRCKFLSSQVLGAATGKFYMCVPQGIKNVESGVVVAHKCNEPKPMKKKIKECDESSGAAAEAAAAAKKKERTQKRALSCSDAATNIILQVNKQQTNKQ